MTTLTTMKKTFSLKDPVKDSARVIEAVKNDVRKYLKRERRKTPPEGFEQWDFACRIGPDATTAASTPVKELNPAIDAVAAAGGDAVYVEILALPAHRPVRIQPGNPSTPETPA